MIFIFSIKNAKVTQFVTLSLSKRRPIVVKFDNNKII